MILTTANMNTIANEFLYKLKRDQVAGDGGEAGEIDQCTYMLGESYAIRNDGQKMKWVKRENEQWRGKQISKSATSNSQQADEW